MNLTEDFRVAIGTLHEMFVRHRGYDAIHPVQESPHLFLISQKDTPSHSILIFLLGSDKLNIEGVKEMLQTMERLRLRHGVLVYRHSVTSSAKKILDSLEPPQRIELFALHELQYDLTQHMYFHPHEKLTDVQELGLLQNQIAKLPKILSTDPVVRYFGFQKNDILRIRRKDGTIVYRVVR